jgi:hypothetical protein
MNLQDMICTQCSAPLPATAIPGETMTCQYCGTSFCVPEARMAGVEFNMGNGSIYIGGDLVGGDKVVIGDDITRPAMAERKSDRIYYAEGDCVGTRSAIGGRGQTVTDKHYARADKGQKAKEVERITLVMSERVSQAQDSNPAESFVSMSSTLPYNTHPEPGNFFRRLLRKIFNLGQDRTR